jgi:hypothetical protein
MVSYLYGHCRALKTQDFATQLKLEHQQFHYDALSKGRIGTVPFIEEQRQIRDEIRKGKRQPERNTWYMPPPEKEEVDRASGWDQAFQNRLGDTLERKRRVGPGVIDVGSLDVEAVQTENNAAGGDVAR